LLSILCRGNEIAQERGKLKIKKACGNRAAPGDKNGCFREKGIADNKK
jgi:hypothetical protein